MKKKKIQNIPDTTELQRKAECFTQALPLTIGTKQTTVIGIKQENGKVLP